MGFVLEMEAASRSRIAVAAGASSSREYNSEKADRRLLQNPSKIDSERGFRQKLIIPM